MSVLIDTLFDKPDNIEIIRDGIAGILKVESANQYKMAKAKKIADAEDFDIRVFLENDRPFSLLDGEESFPSIVNVSLNEIRPLGKSGGIAETKKYEAKFLIDCYACGNFSDTENDTQEATLKAWKIARIVRNILMSGQYAYLDWQGVVLSRVLDSMKSGTVSNLDDSAYAVTVARLELAVSYFEKSVCDAGGPLEGFAFDINVKTGEVLVKV